jgi:Lrp/AsnC family transcriptional regulator
MTLRIVDAKGRLTPDDAGIRALARNNLDLVDRKILTALQRDATISLAQISDSAGLTSTACWRRIRKLEEGGVISKRVTLLAPDKLGLAVSGYVMIRTRNHGKEWIERFTSTVLDIPAVVELHRTTGDVDYLLKIVARDLSAYNQIYQLLSHLPDIADVSAAFSMEAIRSTTELPLD